MSTVSRSTAATPDAEPNWFAEIEFRNYLRDKIPEVEGDRRFRPIEPDEKLARWTEPEDFMPRQKFGDIETLDTKRPDMVRVESDKIVVPLETVRSVPESELEQLIIEEVLDGMFIRETDDGSVRCGTVSDHYDRAAVNEVLGGRTVRYDFDPRPVYVQVPPEHELNELQNIWDRRREQSRDVKMLITARDSETGTGKTTLAVALAKSWDAHGWDASKATLSPSEYVDRYTELESGEILIGDEMEQMADPRRSMSQQNITLTQYWSTMRQWEVSTICTLPSAAMVDKRLRELMDIRINVVERGLAIAYRKKIDDHDGDVMESRIHRIRWNPLDDDPDYRELAKMKKRHMEDFNETAYFLAEDEEDEQKDPEEAVREYRDERIREMYAMDGYTQEDVGEVFDITRERVSQIVNGGGD